MPKSTMIHDAKTVRNERVCREHFRLTLRLTAFPQALPGQFVHLSPLSRARARYRTVGSQRESVSSDWVSDCFLPLLRRAFSIAGLRREHEVTDVDVIYRVVGTATRWMETLRKGDQVSALGPLGNGFPTPGSTRAAVLVAGGVGLPPMLWFAEALGKAGRRAIAFCGAQTRDLLALTLDPKVPPAADAGNATLSAVEFARSGVPVVISTDDGSLGFHGHVGEALSAYLKTNPTAAGDVEVYTCGPQRMMRFVARYCIERGFKCHVCMERAMACGTGTCQSCVVPIRDDSDAQGWRYGLCCRDGPVFAAESILWDAGDEVPACDPE